VFIWSVDTDVITWWHFLFVNSRQAAQVLPLCAPRPAYVITSSMLILPPACSCCNKLPLFIKGFFNDAISSSDFTPIASKGRMTMKMTVFWDAAPCILVKIYRRFRDACCLHHQGDEGSKHLWNVGKLLPGLAPWELEILPKMTLAREWLPSYWSRAGQVPLRAFHTMHCTSPSVLSLCASSYWAHMGSDTSPVVWLWTTHTTCLYLFLVYIYLRSIHILNRA
jgi:hypothetical protein